MAAWSLFRRKPPDDFEMRSQLVDLVTKRLTVGGRIRAEDAICGAAAIVGERCIDSAGELPLRDHKLVPGSRVFSDRINQLLCGDLANASIQDIPADSVFGMLRDRVNVDVYPKGTFPDLTSVFAGYAASINEPGMWGKVPVTVIRVHHPLLIPLQFAYETRARVDRIFEPIKDDKLRCLNVSVAALAALLNMIGRTLSADVGLRLAFEITNGMAKTAPMSEAAFREIARKSAAPPLS